MLGKSKKRLAILEKEHEFLTNEIDRLDWKITQLEEHLKIEMENGEYKLKEVAKKAAKKVGRKKKED